jgi:hypothetical protein
MLLARKCGLDGNKYLLTLQMVWTETLGSFGARYAQKDPEVGAPTNSAIKSYFLPCLISHLPLLTQLENVWLDSKKYLLTLLMV